MEPIRLITALVALVLLGAAAPGSASHAAECEDLYICTSAGHVIRVNGSLTVEGGTASITAERHRGQRFSSQGHADIDDVSATLTVSLDGAAPASCSADPATITFDATDAAGDVRVVSSDPACAFDLTWVTSGAPSPSTDQDFVLAPGVPPAFHVVVGAGATVRVPSTVSGVASGLEAAGSGDKRQHEYVGHVTLIK